MKLGIRRSLVGAAASVGGLLAGANVFTTACSSSPSSDIVGDSGISSGSSGSVSGAVGGAGSDAAVIADDAGHALRTFTPPPTDPGPGSVLLTASGEVNAISGYEFPPFDSTQTWMVDGWNWHILKYIVVVDKITLSNQGQNPATQQNVIGSIITEVDGPFVIDLHKGGPLQGQGGPGEQALAFAIIPASQIPSQTTAYAFGFSTVPAPPDYNAINVNLDESEAADYAFMAANQYSVLYVGVANWAGNQTGSSGGFNGTCTETSTSSSNGGADAGMYNFGPPFPQQMTFRLGFSTPTNYVNCVNFSVSEQTNTTVWGIQTSPSGPVIAQVTVHMDHPFWESFAENSPVHWDQIAAQYVNFDGGAEGGIPEAHTEDFKGVPFSPFTDSNGVVVPWLSCAPASLYTPAGNGGMTFSTLLVPQNPQGVCTGTLGVDFSQDNCPAIRDYYDYIRYTQSTQGHLNSQGICYIDRQYAAPAGGS